MICLCEQVVDPVSEDFLYMMRSPCTLGEGGLFGGMRKSTTIAADICELYSLSGSEFKYMFGPASLHSHTMPPSDIQ